MSVKLCRVPHEHITLPMRVQDRLVPRPGSTIVLVSDGYARLEDAEMLVVVDTSLPIEDKAIVAKEYGGWDDIQLRRYREGRSKRGIIGRVTWILRRP